MIKDVRNISDNNSITVIILTYNEELHIERAILSALNITNDIIIIDSYSNDNTQAIAKKYNIKFVTRFFNAFSDKLNWCIENLEIETKWVIRLDADEYFNNNFKRDFELFIQNNDKNLSAIYVNRELCFMCKPIKYGGYYPNFSIRIWRNRSVFCETRFLDEHLIVKQGFAKYSNLKIIDMPLYGLSQWIHKHNNYANLEALSYLETFSNKSTKNQINENLFGNTPERNKWFKNNFFYRLPIFIRCFAYFIYRYILKFGFLDGKNGFIFHVMHSFWYRFLVDSIIYEKSINSKN